MSKVTKLGQDVELIFDELYPRRKEIQHVVMAIQTANGNYTIYSDMVHEKFIAMGFWLLGQMLDVLHESED